MVVFLKNIQLTLVPLTSPFLVLISLLYTSHVVPLEIKHSETLEIFHEKKRTFIGNLGFGNID